jgi:hypothetical protein
MSYLYVLGIYHLLYATGCIFEYDDEHVVGGKGIVEKPLLL